MPLFVSNDKLGPGVKGISLPPGTTCPGASAVCSKICYVRRYTKRFKLDYSKNLAPAKSFRILAKEIQAANVPVIRIHVAGDFYSAAYIRLWVRLAKAFPTKTFYAYTRSWRIRTLRPALFELLKQPNVKLWWSCDRNTGVPLRGSHTVQKTAWLAIDDQDLPTAPVDLVFRHKRSSFMHHMGGAVVCPHENGLRAAVENVHCDTCRRCFR